MNKLFTLLLSAALLAVVLSAQCGTGPAVASFEAEVTSKIKNWFEGKSDYDAWKDMEPVEAAASKVPDVCQTQFDGKKSCCKEGTVQMFRQIYKNFLRSWLEVGEPWGGSGNFGPKKNFKGNQIDQEIEKALQPCMAEYLKKNAEKIAQLLKEALSNNSTSASVSMSMSGSPVRPQKTDAQKKVDQAMENQMRKADGLLKKSLAELGLFSLRLFRGTTCALCLDPSNVLTTIWDGGVLVKDSDVTEIKKKVSKSLNQTIQGNVEKAKYFRVQLIPQLEALECTAALDILNKYQPEELVCQGDEGCTKAAEAAVTSAWVVQSDEILAENPTSLRRQLQAATLKSSATGIAGQTEDAAEDAEYVQVDGQSVAALETETKAAETELTAAPLNEEEAINVKQEEQGIAVSSIMMFALAMFAFLFGLVF